MVSYAFPGRFQSAYLKDAALAMPDSLRLRSARSVCSTRKRKYDTPHQHFKKESLTFRSGCKTDVANKALGVSFSTTEVSTRLQKRTCKRCRKSQMAACACGLARLGAKKPQKFTLTAIQLITQIKMCSLMCNKILKV